MFTTYEGYYYGRGTTAKEELAYSAPDKETFSLSLLPSPLWS